MNLTVGYIEDLLRKFDKGTEVSVGCNNCNHGAIGSTENIGITDRTNQTYGYIELSVNAKNEGKVGLNTDKEEFYSKEIEKLKSMIEIYEDGLQDMSNTSTRVKRIIEHRIK